jgi:ribosomal protein S18 acetylase RimI-like enzyme
MDTVPERHPEPVCVWRGAFEDSELDALHAEAFEHPLFDEEWKAQLERFSLGWVTARLDGVLVGFVNVVWDGGVHGFVEDTIVSSHTRRRGIGRGLITLAEHQARQAGLEWLHVDFEDHLKAFYFGACGFASTSAGLIRL